MQTSHQNELVQIINQELKNNGFKKNDSKWKMINDNITYIVILSKSWGDQYNIYCQFLLKDNNEYIIITEIPIQRYIGDLTNKYFVNFHEPYNRINSYNDELKMSLKLFVKSIHNVNDKDKLKHYLLNEIKINSSSFLAKSKLLLNIS